MKIKYLLVCLTGVALMGIVFAGSSLKTRLGSGPVSTTGIQTNSEVLNTQQSLVGPIRNLRFTLFEQGIRPSELRIKTGLVNLWIEDKTNNSQGLLVQQVSGTERIALATITKILNYSRGRKLLRLLPGTYELHDASRPANKAVLVVEL